MMRAHTLTILSSVLLMSIGCATSDTSETVATPEVILPLDNDPTDAAELDEWWSDGGRLLRLERSGRYALYDTTNRYRPPVEVGRWDRTSYAALWLEPYDELETRRVRVTIDRPDDAGVLLTTLEGAVFRPMIGPPMVVEDRLLGAWTGDGGRLLLRPDGRYWFDPSGGGARIASSAGHIGRWSLDGDRVRLEPEAGVVEPWTLGFDESGGEMELRGAEMSFVHEE